MKARAFWVTGLLSVVVLGTAAGTSHALTVTSGKAYRPYYRQQHCNVPSRYSSSRITAREQARLDQIRQRIQAERQTFLADGRLTRNERAKLANDMRLLQNRRTYFARNNN